MTQTAEMTERTVKSAELRIPARKAVVVHSGARDSYQLALALSEAGLLESLVTDLFWPEDSKLANIVARLLPKQICAMLMQRSQRGLSSSQIKLCALTGLTTLAADKMPRMPLHLRRWMTRTADATLGRTAGRLAKRKDSAVVSYSYYGFDAFRASGRSGMLFQLHPHPASMRRILNAELTAHPECADSLRQEWELALPEEDFDHLVRETAMAERFLVASSFTRSTLIEHGTPASAIRVVPYGVDSTRFHPDASRRGSLDGRLRVLFVGRINQRKGVKYLLEALRMVGTDRVHLTVCGRVVDGLELFRAFGDRVTVRPSVSAEELLAEYQAADLFVLPSVAEGFGQVLLESLACGLPVLSTTSTAAPDLVEEGREGFVVEPGRPDQLAERMEWALAHRAELARMGVRARRTAETFTWARFRGSAADAVGEFLSTQQDASSSRRLNV